MAVKGNSGVTCISFNTLKDLTEQIFSQITLTQLRTLGIVMFIQLKIEDANETYRKLRTDLSKGQFESHRNEELLTLFL